MGKSRKVDWRSFKDIDTIVVLMGVRNRQRIARELIEAGRDPSEPVAFIERGTTSDQRVVIFRPWKGGDEPSRGQSLSGDGGRAGRQTPAADKLPRRSSSRNFSPTSP